MKFFFDNNISPRIAGALALLVEPDGHQAVHLRDKFPNPSVSDAEWLGTLGEEGGWSVVSGDLRITRHGHPEREAWLRARVISFFLAPQWNKPNVRQTERAGRLLLWWPKLVGQAGLVAPGAAFEVPFNPGSHLRQLRSARV